MRRLTLAFIIAAWIGLVLACGGGGGGGGGQAGVKQREAPVEPAKPAEPAPMLTEEVVKEWHEEWAKNPDRATRKFKGRKYRFAGRVQEFGILNVRCVLDGKHPGIGHVKGFLLSMPTEEKDKLSCDMWYTFEGDVQTVAPDSAGHLEFNSVKVIGDAPEPK